MIKTLSLKFGERIAGSHLVFDPKTITVFVGPNNSGKSLILREVETYLQTGGSSRTHSLTIDHINISDLSEDTLRDLASSRTLREDDRHRVMLGSKDLVTGQDKQLNYWISKDNLPQSLLSNYEWLSKLSWMFSLKLDGATRLKLTDEKPFTDLLSNPGNTHSALLKDAELRDQIRQIIFNAFGSYLCIDPTAGSKIRIRISDIPPPNGIEDKLNRDAVEFHSKAKLISDMGDGIKAFAGILIATLCTDYRILLLDEPEAFLHPPLAYRLGRELSNLAIGGQSNLLVSTHSSNFLLGCLDSGKEINIVRLTYKKGVPAARLLPSSEVIKLVKNPYVRSAGVLSAIFHDGAIVTENDTDRIFYQEINNRLERANRPYARDTQFLNVNGKTGMYRIVGPLRKLGVPVVPILDFDILDNGSEFGTLLGACNLPESTAAGIKRQRDALIDTIQAAVKNQRGIDFFESGNLQAIKDLLDSLSSYGIFIVPNGALESWLPDLGIVSSKRFWLDSVFQEIGENPEDENYLPPQDGDVWEFISKIGAWIADPNRRGMPL